MARRHSKVSLPPKMWIQTTVHPLYWQSVVQSQHEVYAVDTRMYPKRRLMHRLCVEKHGCTRDENAKPEKGQSSTSGHSTPQKDASAESEVTAVTGAGGNDCILSIVPLRIKSKRSNTAIETYVSMDSGSTFCSRASPYYGPGEARVLLRAFRSRSVRSDREQVHKPARCLHPHRHTCNERQCSC
ncbi:unnamed protein product [Arctogadus glacialis]